MRDNWVAVDIPPAPVPGIIRSARSRIFRCIDQGEEIMGNSFDNKGWVYKILVVAMLISIFALIISGLAIMFTVADYTKEKNERVPPTWAESLLISSLCLMPGMIIVMCVCPILRIFFTICCCHEFDKIFKVRSGL